MKGTLKTIKRAPHMLTSKVGMANKSSDAEFNDLSRRFTALEDAAGKLLKDSTSFRDSVTNMLESSAKFATAFETIFSPIGAEYDLERRHPEAVQTIKYIAAYQGDMTDLKNSLLPELELIDSRVLAPTKEYVELLKKIRKAITKRDHKLVDYDRFSNSYTKLRDKKEKTLNDEKNLFKLEQEYEGATQEYEHHNSLLKAELPRFMELSTAFITPLFQSFYYLQLQCLYTMLEKFSGFANGKFDLTGDVESTYAQQLGEAASQLEALTISKRFVSTARMMQATRGNTTSSASSLQSSNSISSRPAVSKLPPPPPSPGFASSASPAPPPYSAGGSSAAATAAVVGKRAPPPPPALKPRPAPAKPAVQYVVALYDFEAQAQGDLSFATGDRIEILERSNNTEDWWTGRLDGRQGSFPGNYVQDA